jgi:hypothetical protein
MASETTSKCTNEPWSCRENDNLIMDAGGNSVGIIVAEHKTRAVACVNALAGYDPAKLTPLLSAVDYLLDTYGSDHRAGCGCGLCVLRVALRELKGGTK